MNTEGLVIEAVMFIYKEAERQMLIPRLGTLCKEVLIWNSYTQSRPIINLSWNILVYDM